MARNIHIPQSVILVSLVLVVFMAGYWFLMLPQFTLLGQGSLELNTDNSPLSPKSEAAVERAKQVAALKQSVDTLVPTEDLQYDLAIQVENTAKNIGIGLTALTFNTVQDDAPKTSAASSASSEDGEGGGAAKTTSAPKKAAAPVTKPVAISLTVVGTYAQLQAFIGQLTGIDRFLQITSLDVSSGQSSSSGSLGATTDQVSANIAATAYYFPVTK